MVRLKRIKNKEDLLDVLAYLIEDVSTFKFINNYTDVSSGLSRIREQVEN
jgi:hypothetical protein